MQSVRPRVAILMAVFQGEPWLTEQIVSILAAEAVDLTLFVSLDPSSDASSALLQSWVVRDARLVVLPEVAASGGAACNFFRLLRDVDSSRYDFIALADQDDIWFGNKLQRACAVLNETGAAGYSSNVLAFWPDGRERLIEKAFAQRRWDFLFEGPGPGCTFVLTARLGGLLQTFVKQHWSGLQPLAYHDWFIYAFARARGERWIIDAWPSLRYRQHGQNELGANSGWRAAFLRWQKVRSGWAFAQSALMVDLLGLSEQPFVRQWQRRGACWLALQAGQCRRRLRDRCLFFLICLVDCVMLRRWRQHE